MLLSTKMMSLK
uniref:Uncharacterized protein n=1 Tax=Arundo donax TaxID=35708 RepID=A0A0A9EGQ2_ARUDO